MKVDVDTKTVKLDYDDATIGLEKIGTILDDEGYPVQASTPA